MYNIRTTVPRWTLASQPVVIDVIGADFFDVPF